MGFGQIAQGQDPQRHSGVGMSAISGQVCSSDRAIVMDVKGKGKWRKGEKKR